MWDLYCGVGGFALHVAAPGRLVTGVEVSEEAVAAARATAEDARLPGLRFEASDATTWAQAQEAGPELVVLNPPRGAASGPSCARSGGLRGRPRRLLQLQRRLAGPRPGPRCRPSAPRRARLFDMFPQTTHHEVMCCSSAAERVGAWAGVARVAAMDHRTLAAPAVTSPPSDSGTWQLGADWAR